MAFRPPSRPRPRPPSSCSTTSTSSCIDRLLDLTKCSHCHNQLKDARMLPCHHSFCFSCLVDMIGSSTSKDEFLCPIDRVVIKVPPYGINSFDRDERAAALEEIRYELEDNFNDETDTSTANIDINLESLNKGVKDIEHSSALSQHAVNSMFEDIYKKLRLRQDEIISEIKRKSQRQISNLQYEKFRLIETKKLQMDQFCDSSFYEEDILEPLRANKSMTSSTPPSPNSSFSRQPNDTLTHENHMSLLSCHIGQQHLEFNQHDATLSKLMENLNNVGCISCDFDLKVKLDRNLLAVGDYPFGLKIGGKEEDGFDWLASSPKGLSQRLSSKLVIANSGRNELIVLDNSFNVKSVIPASKEKFVSVSDVATYGNNIFVADGNASQIVMLSSDGTVVKSFGKPGSGNLELKRPNGICADSRGRIIVSDSLNHRVKVLSADLQKCILTVTTDKKKQREAKNFSFPCGVAVDKEDNIYVTDTNNKRIVQLSREGKFMKEMHPPGCHDPRCVAVSSDGKLLVTDRENGKLLIFDCHSNHMTCVSGIIDSHGNQTHFKQPYGVIVDGTDKIILTDNELDAVFVL